MRNSWGPPASGAQVGGAERKDGQGRIDSGHKAASTTRAACVPSAPPALPCPSQGDTPASARGVPENIQQGGSFPLSQDTETSTRSRASGRTAALLGYFYTVPLWSAACGKEPQQEAAALMHAKAWKRGLGKTRRHRERDSPS